MADLGQRRLYGRPWMRPWAAPGFVAFTPGLAARLWRSKELLRGAPAA